MSSIGWSSGPDIWDRFEHELDEGSTAVRYWSMLDLRDRTPEALVSFLLIEFASHGAEIARIPSLVEQLRFTLGDVALIGDLISDAFEIVVGKHGTPHVGSFDGLGNELQQYLSLPTDPFHLGQFIGGRYYVEQRIGHGTFGVVYKLHDCRSGEKVAGKAAHVTSDERKSRIRRRQLPKEWNAMRQLAGRGCPTCFDLCDQDGIPFLTMEFVDGRSLRDILSESILDPERVASHLASVSRTVAYAHECQILHRDLKPGNIIVDVDENVFVVDFGLVGCLRLSSKHTRDPVVAGTKGYMAPEVLSSATNEVRIDGRSDIYAIGVMLYEMLTGQRPPRVNCQGNGARIGWPDSVPQQLARIGNRCLEEDPNNRYRDAYELAEALESFVCGA